jgi:hypothetical protein
MRALGGLRSLGTSRNNPLITIGTFLVVVCLGYKTAQYILADDLTTLELIGIVFAGGAVVVAILNDWRRGLYALVAWILFEDFVRKYLGNNMMIYFGKDVLVLVIYLSYFRARRGRGLEKFRVPFRVALLLFVWFGVLQAFNPSSKSIFYGILGMKVDFIYIPLVYIGYALLDSEEDLYRFFSYFCVLILIVSGLGLAQSIIGPTFLNPSRLQEDIRDLSTLYRVSPISGLSAYRPTSVFVSASRFGDFLILGWLITLGYGGYLLLRSRRGRTLAFTTLGVVAAASLMSASRGVFMWNSGIALVMTAGFLWGAPWRQREALRVMRAIQRTVLMVVGGFILLLIIFPKELGSRIAIYSETLLPDSPTSELVHRTQTYPIQQFNYALLYPDWPWGYGLGTCTLGTQYVIRLMHAQPMNIGVESGYGNLLLELGIMGLLLWIFLGVSILVSASKVVLELKGTPWFPLCFVIAFYAAILWFPMMFTGVSAYQDFVLNASLWLLMGMLFRLRMFPKAVLAQKQVVARQV